MVQQAGTPEEEASKAATDWLILLQEEPDDRDLRRRFEAWLAASALNRAAWAATQHTSSAIQQAPPAHARHWAPVAGQNRAATARPRRSVLRLTALAAAACLALVLAPELLLRVQADHATTVGEVRSIPLEDGSTVTLAPESTIAVDYRADTRRVELLAGEAFFEVAPAAARPFHVDTQSVRTSVLGTAFNVERGENGATVTLQQGQLSVALNEADPGSAETLRPGQVVRMTWDGGVARSTRPPGQIAAWRNGQLIALDEPLGRVVDRLRRYVPGTILLTDGTLAERTVTGVYNLSDPTNALQAIVQAHGGSVRQVTPWLLIVTGG